ncbi:MAG: hypothetical protein J1F20_05860 [Muribaculaceae bacterium]|nr:hypothetical protein [Muribaculaceae bacterium]
MQRLNITFTADSLDNGWLDNNDLSEVERQMTLIGIQSACNGNATVNADKKITSLDSSLKEYTENVYKFRKENPATWRGTTQFTSTTVADAHVLVVDKTDPVTGNRVLIVFSDGDTTVPVHGVGGIDVDAWRPEFVKIK